MTPRRFGFVHATAAAALTVAVTAAAALAAPAAFASTDGSGVVINEVYLKGGSANAPYSGKFVELYNGGSAAVSLSGWSLQYRSATGTGAPSANVALTGTVAAHDYYLVGFTGNGAVGAPLPAVDQDGGTFNASGTTGTVYLASTTSAVTLPTGSLAGATSVAGVVDVLGYGASNTFEGHVVPVTGANSVPNSLTRGDAHSDSDDNLADFVTSATPTPQKSSATTPTDPPTTTPTDPPTGGAVTIAQIQGTGASTPLAGTTVTTRGVVTASYATGGFNGFVIQTPSTGGAIDFSTHTASDAIFVYTTSATTLAAALPGRYLQVTGVPSEYQGLTELTPSASGVTVLDDVVAAPLPATVGLPGSDAQRESLESMLIAPQGGFTVSNTYSTNQYAEIGLASGSTPLLTPTEVARPGTAGYAAAVADNAARGVTLDDGASINFLGAAANKAIPLPYLSDVKIAVGAQVAFTAPVILDYRNNAWKFQPTSQLVAGGTLPATFSDVRQVSPRDVGGDIQLATFNVLNYFPTTGDQLTGCTYYDDRDGNHITVNTGCDARGAADAVSLKRQQDKIVTAINGLNAEVVSLEEIENSVKFGKDRDFALSTLTAALNAGAGSEVWAYVPSPAASALPPLAEQDVIRTAFIYKKAAVTAVGDSRVLTGSPAFANARQPLAQAFQLTSGGAATEFVAIVNHFKSKGSGTGVDADQNDGQGASNASRVAQATALVGFANELKSSAGTDKVFLLGDFNAYSQEDPIKVLTDAGYIDQGSKSGKYSYSFDGQSGSLDHVLASPAANAKVTGADIWNINSGQSIALEYSRYNYNATNFYVADQYRASDHDPVVVGLSLIPAPVTLNLLNINDFHGRIDANTVKFAGTVEQLKAAAGDANTLFLSDGDNIGASLFASSSQRDQPTIDVLNALGLKASSVGNHEFDQGYTDLTDRVIGSPTANAKWDYLGANVYKKGTTTPALQEYSIFTVGGLRVGVIGAVTQETPSLVSPGGITTLDFGDPVAAVNRVAAQLTDGNTSNGEADVLIAEYHEGAGAGTPDGASLEQEIAAGGAFTSIVNNTSAKVAAIFTGHTHKQYAWDATIPGSTKTRPVLQTGSYGENIGQVVLTLDPSSGSVLSYTQRNVPRLTTDDATLVSTYPRVAQVKTIVDAALAQATVIGNQVVGSASSPITTAFSGGSYGPTGYAGGIRDDRANESSLGNLVADSLVASLSSADRGGATIGIVNPGGLRSDLAAGSITYAQANSVLPFLNNLWTTSLTGAQFKVALEQQWQTNPDGTIPSRPFLKLGLSKNVRYSYDPSAAQGSHITGIWIDGAPISDTASYRVGTFSFLTTGGDNFRVIAQGTGARDSGLVDRDAWIAYIGANSPLSPDLARRSLAVTGAPTAPLVQGATVSLGLTKLDLTSLGAPASTSVTATWVGSAAAPASFPAAASAASISAIVPDDVSGAAILRLTTVPSGATFDIPVTVTPRAVASPTVDVTVSADQKKGGSQVVSPKLTTSEGGRLLVAFVTADGPQATGSGAQKVTSVTGGGLTWSLVKRANGTWGTAEVWQAYATARVNKVAVTAAFAKSGFDGSITVTAFAGAASSVGASSADDGKKGAPTATLEAARGSLLWATGHNWSRAVTPVPLAGQELVDSFVDVRVGDTFWTQKVTAPATGGPVTLGLSSPTIDRWQLVAVEIPAAGSAATRTAS